MVCPVSFCCSFELIVGACHAHCAILVRCCASTYIKFTTSCCVRVLQVVDPVAAAQPAARSKDLMRAMKEAAQGMRGGREVRVTHVVEIALAWPFMMLCVRCGNGSWL